VVDSQSTDRSVEIAESFRARVVQFHFNGTWPKKKQWALDHVEFRNDWIFILDADEVLPPEAEGEFRSVIEETPDGIDGYWINRRFMFMGKWLKYAYYPNWNLRLLRKGKARFEKLTESATASGDNEVHEHVLVEGDTRNLKVEMDHYAFPDVATFIEKHNRYSNWEAVVALEEPTDDPALQKADVSRRRGLKQLAAKFPFRPFLRFLYVYLWQRGFLDGKEGYYFARLHGVYEFLIVAKTAEIKKQRHRPS
jgi:glycosyltransferase involved in cell wall biosynthesis